MPGDVLPFARREAAELLDAVSRAEDASATARLAQRQAELLVSKAMLAIKATLPPGTNLDVVARRYLEIGQELLDRAGAQS